MRGVVTGVGVYVCVRGADGGGGGGKWISMRWSIEAAEVRGGKLQRQEEEGVGGGDG